MSFFKKYAKAIKLIAKITLSVGALYYVFSKVDLAQTLGAISGINPFYLVIAIIVFAASQVCSAFRLNVFYKYIPVSIPQITNIRLFWLGMFYNLFLPGGVGGDGYKVYLINKYYRTPVKRLIGTIFADRLSGLVVILMYLCALVFFIEYDFTAVAGDFEGANWFNEFLVLISPFFKWFIIFIPFLAIGYYLYLRVVSSHLKGGTIQVLVLSIIIQGLQMLSALIILMSMGTEIAGHAEDYLFLFLLSSIMSAIPISLGGLGLREVTFMIGSKYLGLNQDHAVALSIIFYSLSLFVSLFGGYFAYNTQRIFNFEAPAKEEDDK
ncbi:lysylphosphatidylglycerol synthase transmembrane domain-containing protein [Saccharicrinis aurantiacus]|uniref:lysylphosphatidylglycerol synthase transmembrane domain-containing protein n=1 Tax=Saccharicrinis aurantiacus TaxID=1849719 RepID=UPI00249309EA|nr:lysylphosphatidylglycerol synthase transmembrane domain-containing protein [Saccharicrinis aurantiacus]